MDAPDALLRAAFAHHREGRLTEAEPLYRQVLGIDPRHPHALRMLGIILMDGPAKPEAEALFRRHLDVIPDDAFSLHNLGRLLQGRGNDKDAVELFRRAALGKPDLIPIFNDLAVSLHHLGQREEALEVLDQALSADPAYAVAHDNRGMILYDCRRFLDAAQAHLTALAHTPVEAAADRVAILLHLAKAAFEAAEFDASEQASRAILELEPDNADALEHLATVLARLLRQDEAIVLLNRLARLQGLTTGGCQDGSAEATILLLGGVGAGHVPTRYLFDPALFATRTMILLSPDQPDAPLGDVPYDLLIDADVIFNTLGEVDKDGGQIGPADALVARLGKPILNPSHRVARTSREQVHTLFGGIPGLRLPGVRWMTREELADLSELPAPRLIRPGGTHGGKDLVLLRTIADLAAYLAKVPNERFLLIDFFDFKGEHDCYRKFRMIFVDRKPYPYHLAIADSWLVHYWRAEMSRDEWKKREEEAFLTDWRQVFGPVGAAAVEEVGRRLDLDYGGMDCSILPNGEVLFFEANACMLVHLDDAEAEFPYKHRAVPRIRDAVTRMVRDRVAKARP